jgi:hypothetical protein
MAAKKSTKLPKRKHDVRVEVTKTLFPELNEFWSGPKKGTILDGRLDKEGNFRTVWFHPVTHKKFWLEIYPSHFKLLGKFFFRRA